MREKTEHKSKNSCASDEFGVTVGGVVDHVILGKLKSPRRTMEEEGNCVRIILRASCSSFVKRGNEEGVYSKYLG